MSSSKPTRLYSNAREFFDERISRLVDGVGANIAVTRRIDVRTRVNSKLRFLVYEVTSNAEVGVLFETLNERGQPLSEVEKV